MRQFSAKRASRSIEAVLQSLPKSKDSAVSYADGVLSVNYRMTGAESVAELASSYPEFSSCNVNFNLDRNMLNA